MLLMKKLVVMVLLVSARLVEPVPCAVAGEGAKDFVLGIHLYTNTKQFICI